MSSTTETFIPYNQSKDYLLVDFVQLKRKGEESFFHDVMVVSYREAEYELLWSEEYDYYVGKVNNELGFIP